MSVSLQRDLPDESATLALGACLAKAVDGIGRLIVHLQGDLGAGKTTLTRGLLRALRFQGIVRSPTYTLMESYPLDQRTCLHLDLYRLSDPGELEYIGLREYLSDPVLILVEWPERARGVLPPPDLTVALSYAGEARKAILTAESRSGEAVIQSIRSIGGA